MNYAYVCFEKCNKSLCYGKTQSKLKNLRIKPKKSISLCSLKFLCGSSNTTNVEKAAIFKEFRIRIVLFREPNL